ncbi:lysylphosphatidylglycerol synthase transmembrane domain-containing protein [Rhodospirillum rubrum]|uniref:Membrane protein, putative n=1 Tax=Rhodospirillum rubrum (strain ATCC 11170 / ATH 1.1.1 / DSM 467 / LMG 4362 / NCIMB 8255 / S1) TaxID=269796 RepID=Q2RX56_RHORT|nr:YbhN family protein [Rhodospirillum rubrum]ABC21289.1 membrane protein, putative [Rhodospirillum rubrum ATCC 11170]AEO46967.1 hypothetical protein F11_02485 [Rhodospirillum rubrum F11]MBK5952843.1 lysylphosphatidylglycerol synthetase family protein [Rhodospirillum rubrum]QXG80973.1 flippase-like domain-containing protein [Rhodospirillum rubrum]HAQ01439.1 UPF0104 family protein [Rhodospirillum rubrum]
MKTKEFAWPAIGLVAVAFSLWLLYKELRGISLDDVIDSLNAIPYSHWGLAAGSAVIAYMALAGYDRIALLHLGKRLPWSFIALCSFTTYALSHNIGASVFSGAVVRYRAYTSRGLSGGEVGLLVAFCSFTFLLGALLLGGAVLLFEPELMARYFPDLPIGGPIAMGAIMLLVVALYIFGSVMGFKPRRIGRFPLAYPRFSVVLQQLAMGPIELIGAAAIIYFALPEVGNPGFMVVLGIFLASFSVALLSHAPGGLGVLEVLFLTGLPDINQADVLAALVVFRMFYLLIPFALSLVVILLFERAQFLNWAKRKAEASVLAARSSRQRPPPGP